MKRIFIAIRIFPDEELLKMLASVKSILGKESIKWVDPSHMHLTLAFLGDTEEKRINILQDILQDKCTGFGEFGFELAGIGLFKNLHDPRVIWIGIKSGEKLSSLCDLITKGLKSNDFPADDRPFSPHLTIGRIKSVRDHQNLKSVIERFKDTSIQKVDVTNVILFESILMQTGPLYKPVGTYSL